MADGEGERPELMSLTRPQLHRCLTFIDPVTSSVNFPFAVQLFDVCSVVRCEVDECIISQSQLIQNVQNLS